MPVRPVLLAVLVSVLAAGCTTTGGQEAPVAAPTPVSGAAPASSAAPVASERPRPRCASVGAAEQRALARGTGMPGVTVARASAVALPGRWQGHGYTALVGAVLAGPGVDGQAVLLAVGKDAAHPLPVDDVARQTFTRWPQVGSRSGLGRYREQLAGSGPALDAFACAAAGG